MENEKSVCYVCISKRQEATREKTQTFISAFDCFSLQIGISLSYRVTVTVILKVLPSLVIVEVGLKGNKQRIRLDSHSLIIARKIALVPHYNFNL